MSQITFQVVLSTDGDASFAALIYEDPSDVINFPITHQVGFNAGDNSRAINILEKESDTPIIDLQRVNVFRIDGNYYTVNI